MLYSICPQALLRSHVHNLPFGPCNSQHSANLSASPVTRTAYFIMSAQRLSEQPAIFSNDPTHVPRAHYAVTSFSLLHARAAVMQLCNLLGSQNWSGVVRRSGFSGSLHVVNELGISECSH